MSHPLYHSISSQKQHGGKMADYLPLHNWFDESKQHFNDIRHRALRHHTEGIFHAEEIFGPYITNSDGKMVPTRLLGEQHVLEDLGRIPTLQDWLKEIQVQTWMTRPGDGRKFEAEVANKKLDYVQE